MEFTLKINCDNASFEDKCEEVARILRELAENIEIGNMPNSLCDKILFDANGNRCGTAEFIG